MAKTKEKTYRFITIVNEGNTFDERPVYHIVNKRSKSQIGMLTYYSPWKQYVFESNPDCVFNRSCLCDITDFMENEI